MSEARITLLLVRCSLFVVGESQGEEEGGQDNKLFGQEKRERKRMGIYKEKRKGTKKRTKGEVG